jgi:serine/threonine protein phosphatase PrpC
VVLFSFFSFFSFSSFSSFFSLFLRYKRTGGPEPWNRPVTANPEMGHFECEKDDFVLLVCDGVSEGNFPNAEVRRREREREKTETERRQRQRDMFTQ